MSCFVVVGWVFYHRKVLLIFYVTPKSMFILLVYLVNVKDPCTYVF